MDIIKQIIERLPHCIYYEGIMFPFEIIHDANELRICYTIGYVDKDSVHFEEWNKYGCWENTFLDPEGYTCSFLYLAEGIESIEDLESAVDRVEKWLKEKKLIKI